MKNFSNFYRLDANFDARASFYGKALVTIDEEGTKTLYSYETPICEVTPDHKLNIIADEYEITKTTSRHLKEFLRQEAFRPDRYTGKNTFTKAKKIEAETHKI